MTSTQKSPEAQNALLDNVRSEPFHGTILDLGLADKTQVELFAAVGRTKGAFQGVIEWPYLNSLVHERSQRLLTTDGEEAWRAMGGNYGDDGKPTFTSRSNYAAQIVQEIADETGGFIWSDTLGNGWAVRLVTMNVGDPKAYGGLAISWNGGGRIIDPLAREEYRRAVEQQIAVLETGDIRKQLSNIANNLWLYERGEQLLWAIHAAVLMQRRSIVLLPDVGLGEVVWGGNQASWPKNWRGSLGDILESLTKLHMAMLQVGGTLWEPQFTMRSVAVASYENLERTRQRKGFCRPGCPLWNRPEPHNHFLIQIGYGFLGLLEQFSIRDDGQLRLFEFKQRKIRGEKDDVLLTAQKRGEFVQVHLPTKVFGPSPWSQLTGGHRGIIQGLIREVTRVQTKGNSPRRDRADLLVGNLVPNIQGQREIVCPLLLGIGRYVAFNGNGFRRGQGYLIVGRRKRGWLARCGYLSNIDVEGKSVSRITINRITRQFLSDLADVGQILGLTVVGLQATTGGWLRLDQMREIAEVSGDLKALNQIHLRIYGSEDYLDRYRRVLEVRGDFSVIPGADSSLILVDSNVLLNDPGVDLKVRLQRAGLSQEDLATFLGKSKPFISQLLSGKKQWPVGLRERAEDFVAGSVEGEAS